MSTAEILVKIGGKEWTKGSMHRVYMNGLATWFGLETTRYNTGNVSSATLDGEPISNSQAKRIGDHLMDAKFYYDVNGKNFTATGLTQDEFDKIVAAIRQRMQEVA
jgi:hypothetical protein